MKQIIQRPSFIILITVKCYCYCLGMLVKPWERGENGREPSGGGNYRTASPIPPGVAGGHREAFGSRRRSRNRAGGPASARGSHYLVTLCCILYRNDVISSVRVRSGRVDTPSANRNNPVINHFLGKAPEGGRLASHLTVHIYETERDKLPRLKGASPFGGKPLPSRKYNYRNILSSLSAAGG